MVWVEEIACETRDFIIMAYTHTTVAYAKLSVTSRHTHTHTHTHKTRSILGGSDFILPWDMDRIRDLPSPSYPSSILDQG